jgi:uncharacterized glyoxalase superfamily protein PhnB
VHRPRIAEHAAEEVDLIVATVEVSDVTALYAEFQARGVEFAQSLAHRSWGGTDFQVRDPDGNTFSFVTYDAPALKQPKAIARRKTPTSVRNR